MEMQLNPRQITNWQLSAVEQLRIPLQLMPPLPPLTALQETTAAGLPEVSFPGQIRFRPVGWFQAKSRLWILLTSEKKVFVVCERILGVVSLQLKEQLILVGVIQTLTGCIFLACYKRKIQSMLYCRSPTERASTTTL